MIIISSNYIKKNIKYIKTLAAQLHSTQRDYFLKGLSESIAWFNNHENKLSANQLISVQELIIHLQIELTKKTVETTRISAQFCSKNNHEQFKTIIIKQENFKELVILYDQLNSLSQNGIELFKFSLTHLNQLASIQELSSQLSKCGKIDKFDALFRVAIASEKYLDKLNLILSVLIDSHLDLDDCFGILIKMPEQFWNISRALQQIKRAGLSCSSIVKSIISHSNYATQLASAAIILNHESLFSSYLHVLTTHFEHAMDIAHLYTRLSRNGLLTDELDESITLNLDYINQLNFCCANLELNHSLTYSNMMTILSHPGYAEPLCDAIINLESQNLLNFENRQKLTKYPKRAYEASEKIIKKNSRRLPSFFYSSSSTSNSEDDTYNNTISSDDTSLSPTVSRRELSISSSSSSSFFNNSEESSQTSSLSPLLKFYRDQMQGRQLKHRNHKNHSVHFKLSSVAKNSD